MSFAAAMANANAAILATCGEAVTVAGVAVTGIYSAPYQAANMDAGLIESYAPTLAVLDADAATVAHGSVVVARATTFYVIGIQPDGAGMTNLILSEDAGA